MAFGRDDPSVDLIDTRTTEQRGVSRQLGGFFGPRIGRGLPRFKGERVAGLSPFEERGLVNLDELLSAGRAPLFGKAETALDPALEGAPSTEISPEITEEFFRTSIFDPAFKDLQETLIPEIESQFAGNFFSSARAGATTEAIEAFGSEQAGILAEIQFANEQQRIALEESAAARQLTAAGQATELGALEEAVSLGRIEASQTFGSLPRRLEQARLDAEFDEFIRTLPEFNPVIAQALSFLGTPGLTAVIDPGTESPFGDILGAAATIGAAAI